MTPTDTKNNHLLSLLALQQDGKFAISAPTNWTRHKPLLEVATEVDTIIDALHNSILLGEENKTARWHFFIGSPGNGKSAAMGKLCRQLLDKRCRVLDETGVSINDLDPTAIPYAINVYEDGNQFASAQIVQDASVVRNPFSADVDPAKELLETLKHAWEKGISLVVCTNRGVLEKAHRDNHMDQNVNSTAWFKIISAIVSNNHPQDENPTLTFDGKRSVFRQVKVEHSHLDNRSLLLGRSTFEHLIQRAVADPSWECCAACSACSMCPFKANRDWLNDTKGRAEVLKLLTRAEVLSGQIIVFREALAIISLILAGCPRDYDTMHPCDWVHAKATCNDIFSLASRRIYMNMFASYCPHGLEANDVLRKRQIEAFGWLHETIGESSSYAKAALKQFINGTPPSTDVGVTRLLGEKGIIATLDPCREVLPSDFYDKWDTDFDALPTGEIPYVTDLERKCISIWKEMEETLELATNYSSSEAHWALRRWTSNFLLHLGALLEGRSAWKDELDRFSTLLGLVAKPPETRTTEDKRTLRQLDTRLESLLNVGADNQPNNTIPLSDAVTLTGQWVQEKLKPKTISSEASGSVSLAIEFAGGERAVFAALMYLWLTRRTEGKLDARCFPQDLLAGVADARVRAAARGKYAFENDNVELIISTGTGEQFRLTRYDGDIDVTH